MRRVLVMLLASLAACSAAPALAAIQLPVDPKAIAGNPADRLVGVPMDEAVYDPARRCVRTSRPGVKRMVAWLAEREAGQFWGSYRCERWGKGKASLHAEGRAIDWQLDHASLADRAEARNLILLLTAPDRVGEPNALARRMGVQELIWDCGYWSVGMADFEPYTACLAKDGRRRRKVNVTVAHRDHIHIGMSKAGAMGRTSFWADRSAEE